MRVLLDDRASHSAGINAISANLDELYAFPDGPWLRANFVSTLDGSATGVDGLSGSINTPADKKAYAAQRRCADVVLVGAGTARAESYQAGSVPLAVVSGRGHLPEQLVGCDDVVLVTCAASGRTQGEGVWICGKDEVDLREVRGRLHAHGWNHVLCEGGPSLFADAMAAGIVDELALTLAPRVVAGSGPRVTKGDALDLDLTPIVLLEEDGTVLGLWRLRSDKPSSA